MSKFKFPSFSTRKNRNKKKKSNKNNKGSRARNIAYALGVVLVIGFAIGMIVLPLFGCYAVAQGIITGAQFLSFIGYYTPIYELISESIFGTLQVIPSIIPMI